MNGGTCSSSALAEALHDRNRKENIKVTIFKSAYYLWEDDWQVDSLKLYFTLEEEDETVLSCALCNEKTKTDHEFCSRGFGFWVDDDEKGKTANCYVLETSPRSL